MFHFSASVTNFCLLIPRARTGTPTKNCERSNAYFTFFTKFTFLHTQVTKAIQRKRDEYIWEKKYTNGLGPKP